MQNQLSKQAKALIISFAVYAAILPLITTFTNAFIWRERQDLNALLIFYVSSFIFVTLATVLNGVLLKHVPIKWLYAIGLISISVGMFLLVNLGKTDDLSLIIFGAVWGFIIGLYWANRNVLTQKTTNDENRNYFSGLETSSQTLISMVVPAVMGIFIEHIGSSLGQGYIAAYKILVWVMLIGAILGALYILKASFTDYTPKRVLLRKCTKSWAKARLIMFFMGVTSGVIMIFPSFVVLSMIGKEASLGVMDSIASLAGAVIIYFIGRKITSEKRIKIFHLSLGVEVIGTLFLYAIWGPLGAGMYVLLTHTRARIFWVGLNPLMMKHVDKEAEDKDIYPFVVDREVFLNIGRIVVIFLMFLLNSAELVVRVTPILVIISTVLILVVEKSTRRN